MITFSYVEGMILYICLCQKYVYIVRYNQILLNSIKKALNEVDFT